MTGICSLHNVEVRFVIYSSAVLAALLKKKNNNNDKKARSQAKVSDTFILKEVVAWRCSGTCCSAKFAANHL